MRFIKQHWRRVFLSSLLILLFATGGLVFWAGSQIASPSRRSLMDYHREYLSNPSAHGIRIDRFTASDGTPCLFVTPDPSGNLGERGVKIRKQLSERYLTIPPAGHITGTLVLTHGRKGRKEDYLPIAERFCAAGFRCVIPDLPGHGDHPVNIATYGVREATLPARVLNEAATRFAFDPQPAGLMGMSMGGSVAMHAADLPDAPWKALVVISSFDSFPAVIHGQATVHAGGTLGPLWAQATDAIYQWKTGIPIETIQPHRHAAAIRIPTLIAHGTADSVVAMAAGRRLYDSLPDTTTKSWLVIPGAGHDNVLITDFPIYAEIAEWMMRNVVSR
jgi:alpha-beta hydrolase superfamily lysophospholipase